MQDKMLNQKPLFFTANYYNLLQIMFGIGVDQPQREYAFLPARMRCEMGKPVVEWLIP